MTRLTPVELLIANLGGKLPEGARGYKDKQSAHAALVQMAGVDLGMDPAAWEKWAAENETPVSDKAQERANKLLSGKFFKGE